MAAPPLLLLLAAAAALLLLPPPPPAAAHSAPARVFSVADYGAAGDGSRYDTAAIQAAGDASRYDAAAAALLLLPPPAPAAAHSAPARVFSVADYGAAGDGSRYDTGAIQAAVEACAAAGGGRVLLPAPGDYLTATVHLRSGVVLEVAPGARLLGGTRQRDYPPESRRWYVVLAENTTGAGVTGGGEVNGQGGAFVVAPSAQKNVMVSWNVTGDCVGDECRPRLVGFIDSKDVAVHDVTLNQPALWWER